MKPLIIGTLIAVAVAAALAALSTIILAFLGPERGGARILFELWAWLAVVVAMVGWTILVRRSL